MGVPLNQKLAALIDLCTEAHRRNRPPAGLTLELRLIYHGSRAGACLLSLLCGIERSPAARRAVSDVGEGILRARFREGHDREYRRPPYGGGVDRGERRVVGLRAPGSEWRSRGCVSDVRSDRHYPGVMS